MTDTLIHCMKCKHKTPSDDLEIVRMAKGGHRLSARCRHCNCKKSRTLSQQHADGILGKLLGLPNGIPILSSLPIIGPLLF